MSALETYQHHLKQLQEEEMQLFQKKKKIAWLRFLTVVGIFAWCFYTWHLGILIILAGSIVGIGLFLFLVAKDVTIKNRQKTISLLKNINTQEIETLNGNWSARDSGVEFQAPTHPYANDLDIFGTHSLFQMINRAKSFQGRSYLASLFSTPSNREDILLRQIAIQNIKEQTEWRQYLEAYGTANPLDADLEKKVNLWLHSENKFTGEGWQWVTYLYPVITLSVLYFFLDNTISTGLFSLAIVVFLLFSFGISKKINATYQDLDVLVRSVNTLQMQLEQAEKLNAGDSELLKYKLHQLNHNGGVFASQAIRQLKSILGKFEIRMNVYLFLFLNPFLLWDVRQAIALHSWKLKHGNHILTWLDALAELEALSSLGTVVFNNPHWAIPTLSPKYFHIEGSAIGHPLLSITKCVTNSFSLDGSGKIALITGSNMGGKSTFLRSIGVNAVLAYSGATVCASSFEISVSKLMSSMRIADNLAEDTSTFYAELKKLRAIIEAVNNGERPFILLDEILRGTNSLDRHAGSQALMLQLIRENVVAIIATHDVELAELVKNYPDAIENYHFDVQVDSNNKLYFDYQLKHGVCQRMNASILMKQIGIEL